MITIKTGRLKIVFKFGFFLATTLLCLTDKGGLALCMMCSCVIHEIGHITATILCNVKIEKIVFNFGGIKMVSECKIKSISTDIFVLLSGPFFNMLSALFYYHLECYTAFSVNLILALFNLLPFSTLDGGAILKKLLEYFCINADFVMKLMAILSAVTVCVMMYYFSVNNIMIYGVIIFLVVFELCY